MVESKRKIKKKIQIVTIGIKTNGGVRVLLELANFFRKQSYQVEILTSFIDKDLRYSIDKNITINAYPNLNSKILNFFLFFFLRSN